MDPLLFPSHVSPLAPLLERIRSGDRGLVLEGVAESARSLCLYLIATRAERPLLNVCPNDSAAERLVSDLKSLTDMVPPQGGDPLEVSVFPSLGADPYQGLPPHPRTAWERVDFLGRLRRRPRGLFVCSATSLLQPLVPPRSLEGASLHVKEWEEIPLPPLQAHLEAAGYTRVDLVTQRGEWSRRGGILDVHPAGATFPVRLEMYGEQVESIRTFDPFTQRSRARLDAVEIPPMRELSLTEEAVRTLVPILEKADRCTRDAGVESRAEALRSRGYFMGVEALAGLVFPAKHSLFDYLADGSLIVVEEPAEVAGTLNRLWIELREKYRDGPDPGLPPPEGLYLGPEEILPPIRGCHLALEELPDPSRGGPYRMAARTHTGIPGRMPDLLKEIRAALGEGWWEVLVLETAGRIQRMREILADEGLPTGPVIGEDRGGIFLRRGILQAGFRIPEARLAVYTEREIFGAVRRKAPPPRRTAFHSDFRDLRSGDLVVHVEHGIGRFLRLERLPGDGHGEGEFLALEYREGDRLYLPIDRLDLLQRYSGSGDRAPSLDRLGGRTWEKTRRKVQRGMREMARELLELYAARKSVGGHAFPPDAPWQKELEDAFPFEETPDQDRAISEVKRDMERAVPMDRLLCGDVGFGKTEVAIRSTFKAVMDGRQVAVLVPTTVLAYQHYLTFRERFSPFPVRVEMLSRFRGPGEQRKILKGLGEGRVDVVIGTHRLLSRDVRFRNLGLLIIDEEQRFGVSHKERIQALRRQVDVLTMTATPIPRTLQLSLAGIRDLSLIETPPRDRLEIQTSIVPFREGILASAIRSELEREGQVYFVHNRVESIASMAHLIRRISPGVRIGIAHGKLSEIQLEKTMLGFVRGEFDLLLSTTIIENGLDIPNVNTLIVNRADRFGLSQLYQLRGRVGRSYQRAFAYFLVPSFRVLTPASRKRLRVLQEFTELGSGFRIAAMDLEIRGAGNVLGLRQHGHIATVGFETYIRLLENTVRELKGEEVIPVSRPDLNLRLDYTLPEDYIADEHQRLHVYKRISSVRTEEELEGIWQDLEDSFGRVPRQGVLLFDLARLRLLPASRFLQGIDYSERALRFRFGDLPAGSRERLLQRLSREPGWRLTPQEVLVVPAPLEGMDRIRLARNVLKGLE